MRRARCVVPVSVEEYIAASDNANDYGSHLLTQLEQTAREDIDDLIQSPLYRDEELWTDDFGVDAGLLLSDYDEVAPDSRDLDWTLGLAGLTGAATAQFFLDNNEITIIKPVAYRLQVVGALSVTRDVIVTAGTRGIEVISTTQFVALQATYVERLAPLRGLSSPELYRELVESNAMRSFDKIVSDQVGYVARMTNLRPGSIEFKEEVAALVNTNSKRAVKGMSRRAVERVYLDEDVGGDFSRPMVWVVEGGKSTCERCSDRAGRVQRYSQWIQDGLPGASVCQGGDLCNCHLAAV